VSDVVKLQGVLNPIETLRLATRDPGIVTQVLVSEGSSVSAGDTIAVLDSEMYGAEVSAAQNELQIARQETKNDVDLQYAKMSSEVNQQVLSRSRRAAEQFAKSVSGTELERLRLEYERSRLSGLQAEREQDIHRLTESLKGDQLTIAQIRLKNRHVNSEIDGTVVEVFHTAGEYVNAGEPIARILNLNRLRVICAGSAREIRLSKLSDEAVFKFVQPDGEEISIPAKVTFLSPEIDPVRQTFAVWAEIQNDEALLRSGNIGTLEIKLKK
jgi:multidrug efflux pump subunit AcrA (membrane-fusion protein)